MSTAANPLSPPGADTRWGSRIRAARKASWLGYLACGFLVLVLVLAVFGGTIAPHDPLAQDLSARLAPPFWSADGSTNHLFGTDELGRDVLSRIIAGAKLTLFIGLLGASVEAVLGVVLGLAAGSFGGWIDRVVMSASDIQMAFPTTLLYLLIFLVTGGGPLVIALALAFTGWMVFARIVRVSVMSLRKEGFVEAAVAGGVRRWRIILTHIVPHLRGTIIAVFLFEVPRIMLAEAGLSFLGVGVQIPDISWGLLLGGSQSLVQVAPYLTLLPGLMIVLTAVSMNLFAGLLEPLLDPERRRRSSR